MKKAFLLLSFFIFTFAFSVETKAQETVDPQAITDNLFEQDAQHNFNVAYQYYKLKKAYKGVLMRFEETYAAYPQFSKMDEFLYIAAMSSYYLSENKGRQKIDTTEEGDIVRFAPKRLREEAVAYFGVIVEQYPNSKFKKNAEKMLKKIKDGK